MASMNKRRRSKQKQKEQTIDKAIQQNEPQSPDPETEVVTVPATESPAIIENDDTDNNTPHDGPPPDLQTSLEGLLGLLQEPTRFLNHEPSSSNDSTTTLTQLNETARLLFRELEHTAHACELLDEKPTNSDRSEEKEEEEQEQHAPLSGLAELYVGEAGGDGEPSAVDAETIWGQVEMQNAALMPLLNRRTRKLARAARDEDPRKVVRLLDMREIDSEEEEGTEEEDASDDEAAVEDEEEVDDDEEDDEDDEEKDEDEEAKNIRERMERSMKDADDNDSDESDDDASASSVEEAPTSTNDTPPGETEDEDPAALELNDGFFNIADMEDFADEEEDFHMRMDDNDNNDDDDSDSASDDNSDDGDDVIFGKQSKTTQPPKARRKYRADDEIELLETLYTQNEDDDSDDGDEDPANMTAAEFFGKPNQQYFNKSKTSNKATASKPKNKPTTSKKKKQLSWKNDKTEKETPDWREDVAVEKQDDNDDSDDSDDEESSDEKENDDPKPLTPHGAKSKRLREETKQLETEALAEKPWAMRGEMTGTSRPVNSLLDATPQFEVASKPAPQITKEHTANLEDIIKRRILDEDWDDVIPRELPDIGGTINNEPPEVSQEKSKLGLGELYEREYLKKAAGIDVSANEVQSKETEVKEELKTLFANLCSKLDALSNYHFAPRPIAPEVDVTNLSESTPAIAMEEVLPLHVSDARAVAPEQVFQGKKGRFGLLMGDSEADQAERKAARSSKKATRRRQKKQKLADEKLISRLKPGLGLNNPYEKRKLREELQVARATGKVIDGTTIPESGDGNDIKTSAKFFKKMQDEVQMAVHGDDAGGDKKRKRNNMVDGNVYSSGKSN